MRRLTANVLLLFALMGNLVPVAVAATPTATPKCCLRKNVHRCHNSAASVEGGLSFASTSCCSHDCCRDAIPAQWANPEAKKRFTSAHQVEIYLGGTQPAQPSFEASALLSTRAPPQFSNL